MEGKKGTGREEVRRRGKKAAEEEKKEEREFCLSRTEVHCVVFLLSSVQRSFLSARGLLPVCLIGVLNPHCSCPPHSRGRRMTSGPHRTSGPCPRANTTQCFDWLFRVLSTRTGCIVNMPAQLYCPIMRVIFYMRTGVSRGGH